MIIFKQIRYRNFLSSGNTFTKINFTESQNTLIVGHNGSGKSTLLDALCFVLFNKAFRKVNKNQIVNSTNEKECVVEIDFLLGTKEYTVKRGIKPNIFEIWIDGELQNQLSSSVDQQKQLEENILKLNYKSFTQIVILGSASFIPFMQLSTANRREVVEDLLDIKIFSAMNSVIKERIRNINNDIKELSIAERMTEEKIEMQKEHIKSIEKINLNEIEDKKNKINSISELMEKIIEENQEKQNQISENFQPKLDELANSTKKVKTTFWIKRKTYRKSINNY